MSNTNQKVQLHDIVNPHEHDVLSGRGNFVNYHAGNEHFRALVRKHKVAYVACPKPQKGKFSRMIVDEIRNRTPPGRFLKQDPATKLWHDIGEKKALDKTRQALREGAPEIMKEIGGEGGSDHDKEGEGEIGVPAAKAVPKDGGGSYGGVLEYAAAPNQQMVSALGGMHPGGMFHSSQGRHSGLASHLSGEADLHRKLASMYHQHDDDDYDELEDQFEPRPIDPRLQSHLAQQNPHSGQGMPPALQRQNSDNSINSIKVEKVFIGGNESLLSNKQKMQGSSLSVMSLSMSEFAAPATDDVDNSNLSDLFSGSVRIADGPSKSTVVSNKTSRTSMEKSTPSLLDMSVATIGDQMSEFGSTNQMKHELTDSQADMSFTKVFEEGD